MDRCGSFPPRTPWFPSDWRSGELKNFTGIDSPYEAPETPEIHIDTTAMTAEQAAEAIFARLEAGFDPGI